MIQYHIERKSSKPVYIQLKDTLKAAIEDGRLQPLSPMPLVTRIAEDAGVSLRTADNALQELVKEGLCFRRPKKGTFVRAKEMVQKRRVCGILGQVDPVSYPLQTLLYCGIMEAAVRKGHMVFIIPPSTPQKTEEDPELVLRRFERSAEFEMVGVFVVESQRFEETVKLAKAFPHKRFFYLNYQGRDFYKMPENMAAIVNDDFTGAYQLAEHVFSEYKPASVLILTMPLSDEDITYQERCRGFRTAARELSVPVEKELEMKFCSAMDEQMKTAYSVIKKHLSGRTDVRFIFCVNDLLASGAMKAVEELGLQDRIQVSGYDCIHNLPDYSISTVKVCYTEMGRKGLEKMLSSDTKMQTITKLPPIIIKTTHKTGTVL